MNKVSSVRRKAALIAAAAGVAGWTAAPAAAQEGNSVIGPPQLRDFQLEPRQRIVTQPRPDPAPPAEAAPEPAERAPAERAPARLTPAPGPQVDRPAAPAARPSTQQAAPRPTPALQQRQVTPGAAEAPAPLTTEPEAPTALAPPAAAPSAAAAPPQEPVILPDLPAPAAPGGSSLPEGPPAWLYFLAFATLGLLGYGYWLRRRSVERRALAGPAPGLPTTRAPAEPRAPRPAPQPRPWLEVELNPERATIDLAESVIEFELVLRNSGGSEARDVRLQARMFASTSRQDEEIGAYFKADEAAYRTIAIPPIAAGDELLVKGSVDMKQDRISALRVEGKLLFIPLIGVNARYGWGNGRTGQTSRSWVIGREPADGGDKMRPFRLDLGARVHRTIGQRPYTQSRRV